MSNDEYRMMNGMDKKARKFDLEERLINFAIHLMEIPEALPNTRAGNHIAGQLIHCGTSPAPNYAEAQSAESRNDFIHKIKIVLKELREARVWLVLIHRRGLLRQQDKLPAALAECNELISIFVASISTARQNRTR
jgi:four helix bundle protein